MKQHDLSKTYSKEVAAFTLTLNGDGSNQSHLSFKGYSNDPMVGQGSYVSSDTLRGIAKQLKKWAKGIEASGS